MMKTRTICASNFFNFNDADGREAARHCRAAQLIIDGDEEDGDERTNERANTENIAAAAAAAAAALQTRWVHSPPLGGGARQKYMKWDWGGSEGGRRRGERRARWAHLVEGGPVPKTGDL